jgi:hypothetical protein
MKSTILQQDIKLKSGRILMAGEKLSIEFAEGKAAATYGGENFGISIRVVIKSFNLKAPSIRTMEKWSEDGIARTIFGAKTEPDGYGPNGEPSWLLALNLI